MVLQNMNYGCCRLLTVNGNTFARARSWNSVASASLVPQFCNSKSVHNDSTSPRPVKLAYTLYESVHTSTDDAKSPVAIMHGLFGSKNNWNSLSQAIHKRTTRKVICVDARNHGDSPHSAEMTYKHMAEDVVHLLKDLGFEKSILLGHSMGGSAMMYTALSYPELVEKLIVVDMSPVRVSPSLTEMGKIFEAMRSVSFEDNTTLLRARRSVDEQLAKVITAPALRQFLMTNLVEAEPGKYRWRVNLPVLEHSFHARIATFPNVSGKTYNGPTLFIGGRKSDYIRVEDHDAIKQLFPTARIVYIEGANHWVHADKPAEFLDLATEFINQRHP